MVQVVKRLNVLSTCREYGNREANYLIGPWRGTYHPTVSGCRVVVLVVEGGGPVPRNEKKGEMLRGDFAPHACVLGLPCKAKKLDSNRSAAHG